MFRAPFIFISGSRASSETQGQSVGSEETARRKFSRLPLGLRGWFARFYAVFSLPVFYTRDYENSISRLLLRTSVFEGEICIKLKLPGKKTKIVVEVSLFFGLTWTFVSRFEFSLTK